MAVKNQLKKEMTRKDLHDLELNTKTAFGVCEFVRDHGKEYDLPDTLICMAQMYRG